VTPDERLTELKRSPEEPGVTKFLRQLDQIEAAGRAVFKAVVRVAELIALTVFFQVAAVLTNNTAIQVLAVLLMIAVGLYVGVTLGSVPEKLFPPRKATNKQAVLALALFLMAAVGGFYLVQTISISIAQIVEEQIS
jgi:hypothetical protein